MGSLWAAAIAAGILSAAPAGHAGAAEGGKAPVKTRTATFALG